MKEHSHIVALFEAAIALETGAASLYRLFAELHPEDRGFWSRLQLEEKSHATLLRAAMDSFGKRETLPGNLLPASLEKLVAANVRLVDVLEECKVSPPSRRKACELAIALENEAGEEHYNEFMGRQPESRIEAVFQQLNRNDKDHARRIEEYLAGLPEPLTPESAAQ